LPQRLLGPLSARLAAGNRSPALILAVAGWMRYVGGRDEAGLLIDVRDPLAATLAARSGTAKDVASRVARLLQMTEIFDPSLAANAELGHDLGCALQSLETNGVLSTLKGQVT
jgi:fructuronate reductase